jgi:hypothetical protein
MKHKNKLDYKSTLNETTSKLIKKVKSLMIVIKAIKLIFRLLRVLPENKISREMYSHFSKINVSHHIQKKERIKVLIQSVEDPIYYGIFSAIVFHLKRNRNVDLSVIIPRSINYVGNNPVARFYKNPLVGYLISSQWLRLYTMFSPHVAYRSQVISDIFARQSNITNSVESIISAAVSGEMDINDLRIQNIPVGDLVIDTYLRYKPSPYVKVDDPFMRDILKQAHLDVERSLRYFHRHRPHVYLTSYSVYLQHGVAVRAAISVGVPVHSFGTLSRFSKQLTIGDSFHTPDVNNYKKDFDNLPNDKKCYALKCANDLMTDRISGKIDQATSYMKKSAYSAEEEFSDDLSNYAIIFLHDFYDSPHIWSNIIFNDFWSWATFTIEFLLEHNIKFAVKMHPNQRDESKADCEKLKLMYPQIPIISDKVNNKDLVDCGIACGITVYGTVAHELAFLGIPSICCSQHPHHTFDFCRTAKDLSEYKKMLISHSEFPLSKEKLSEQALEFVYMHTLHGSNDEMALRRAWASYFRACDANNSDEALASLEALARSEQFQRVVHTISCGKI